MSAPAIPGNLVVIRDESRQNAVLRWDKVTQDVDGSALTVTAYKVYQSDTADQRYLTLVKTVTATAASTQLTALAGLSPEVLYYFAVAAYETTAGEGAKTDPEADF